MQGQDARRAIVQRMIDAGESEENIATVIQSFGASSPRKEPTLRERMNATPVLGAPSSEDGDSLPSVLATMASMTPPGRVARGVMAAPRVISTLARVGPKWGNAMVNAARAGGAGGAGSLVRSGIDDKPETLPQALQTAAGQVGLQGGLQLGGSAIEAGGRSVARGTMRRALGAPKGAMEKYQTPEGKDLIDEALDRGVRVTKGGFQKIQAQRTGAQDGKAGIVDKMHDRVSILTDPIKRQAAEKTLPDAVGQRLAGLRDTMDPTPAISAFGGGRPGLKPGELELAKKALDADTSAAHQAVRMGRKPALDDMERMALAKGANESMEAVAPGYRALNQEIRQTMGLENAVRGRLAQPATGLADDITAGVISAGGSTPEALALRALRGPAALSHVAALVAQLAKGGKVAPAALRSLLVTSRDR